MTALPYVCDKAMAIDRNGQVKAHCKGILVMQDEGIDWQYGLVPYVCAQCQRVVHNVDEDPSWARCEPDPAAATKVVGPEPAQVEEVDGGGAMDYAAFWLGLARTSEH